ncbi:MAG TPA: hypothetical protein VLL52_11180 [Anaerolineae bacterium]|nr:hypothetical protein [Anaerolineae bacterium]
MNPTLDPALLAELVQESVAQGKKPYLTVISGSMAPLLQPNDQVQTEGVDLTDLQIGDIIVIAGVQAFMTHRYYGTLAIDDRLHLITRGDRSLTYDSPWPPNKLVGRVIARRRRGRRLDLGGGLGRRLNHTLFRLAQTELRLFTHFRPHPNARLATAGYIDFPHYDQKHHFGHTIYRRLNQLLAVILTTIITLTSQE